MLNYVHYSLGVVSLLYFLIAVQTHLVHDGMISVWFAAFIL